MSATTYALPLTIAAVFLAVSCCLGTILWIKRRGSKPEEGEVVIELLPMERELAIYLLPVSSLTWFQGSCNETLIESLRARTEEIMKANRWLGGRVTRRTGNYSLVYSPQKKVDMDCHFFSCPKTKRPISTDVAMDELQDCVTDQLVKGGPDQLLWKVSVIPCSKEPDSKFAVVFSLSHIVADGHTFYRLQNMLLDSRAEVEPLKVQRIMNTEELQLQAMCGQMGSSMWQTAGFFVGLLGGFSHALLACKRSVTHMYLVNQDGMEATKRDAVQESQQGVSFVSTNDVLTSWFLQNCKCDDGFMALNFRGKLEGHTESHAGNYEDVIYYQEEDSATPALIRQSLLPVQDNSVARNLCFQRRVTNQDPLPGFWSKATGSIALATNWASFAKPCFIQGCQELLHVPLTSFGPLNPTNLVCLIIFRAGPQGTGVIVTGTPKKLEDLALEVPFLSKENLM